MDAVEAARDSLLGKLDAVAAEAPSKDASSTASGIAEASAIATDQADAGSGRRPDAEEQAEIEQLRQLEAEVQGCTSASAPKGRIAGVG